MDSLAKHSPCLVLSSTTPCCLRPSVWMPCYKPSGSRTNSAVNQISALSRTFEPNGLTGRFGPSRGVGVATQDQSCHRPTSAVPSLLCRSFAKRSSLCFLQDPCSLNARRSQTLVARSTMKFRLCSRVREQSRVEERSIKFSAVTDKVITRVPYTVTRAYFLRLLIYDMGSWIQRTPGQ